MMNIKVNKQILVKGSILPACFIFINYVLLKHVVNPIQIGMILFISFFSIIVYSKNKDYLDPRLYFPILYFLLFWLGDFEFLIYKIVPIHIWVHYLIGIIGYYLGAGVGQNVTKIHKESIYLKDYIGANARWVILTIYGMSVLVKLFMFYQNGIPLLASNIDASRQSMSENYGLLKAVAYSINVIPVFAFYDIVSRKKEKKSIPITDVLLILFSFSLAILDVSRLLIIEMVIPMLFIFILKVKRLSLKNIALMMGGVLIYIGINQIFRNMRLDTMYLSYITANRQTNLFENIMISSLNNFRVGIDDYFKVTEIVPAFSSYTFGMLFFNSLLSPLPGKQITIGYYVAELLGLSFDGIGAATTILGMFYIDGGLLIIFVGMFLFGWFVQRFYKAYIMKNTVSIRHLTAVYVLFYAINTIRTNVLPNIEPVMAIFYYWFFGYIIYRTRNRTIHYL